MPAPSAEIPIQRCWTLLAPMFRQDPGCEDLSLKPAGKSRRLFAAPATPNRPRCRHSHSKPSAWAEVLIKDTGFGIRFLAAEVCGPTPMLVMTRATCRGAKRAPSRWPPSANASWDNALRSTAASASRTDARLSCGIDASSAGSRRAASAPPPWRAHVATGQITRISTLVRRAFRGPGSQATFQYQEAA